MNQRENKVWEVRLDSIADFKALCEELGCTVDVTENVSVLAEPVKTGNLLIPNSLAIHPMEGCDGDSQGRPGELTFRRYKRFAAGGAGLIWGEAVAVVPEARANPKQLWLNEQNKDEFSEMIRMMRQVAAETMGSNHKPVLVAQLTHSGRYSNAKPLIPERDPYRDPLIAEPKPNLNRASKVDDSCIISDEELDKLQDAYVKSAGLAYEVGFDAIDIKACHGYLISELLASRNRNGKYGGSFKNRTKFLLEVIDKIRQQLGSDKNICVRLGFYDAIPYPYGWGVDESDCTRPNLAEPKRLVELLMQRGVRLINFTISNPYYNPHIGRPFNRSVRGGYPEPEHPLVGVERLIELAGQVQKEFPDLAVVGTGYSWLRQMMPYVAAGAKINNKAKIIGAGRMAFAYPDFAKDILTKGSLSAEKVCIGCSGCTQLMRDGRVVGCIVRDNEIYKSVFK